MSVRILKAYCEDCKVKGKIANVEGLYKFAFRYR
jgi:hypothetical protein